MPIGGPPFPIGLQLVGAPGADGKPLQAAAEVEALRHQVGEGSVNQIATQRRGLGTNPVIRTSRT